MLNSFVCVQREKARGPNGGTRASWEGVLWRGPQVAMSHVA